MANAPYPFPAVPYAATYCYPPHASAQAPPPGFFPAPLYAFPYPASASYPPNPWSTSSTPSESIFPAPSYDPSTIALQHHPIHSPYPQVPVSQPETTAPPATASNFSPSASSPSGEPTAPPPRGYATPPLTPSTAPTPSSPLPFPAPGPWKPPPPPSGAPSSPSGAGVTPPFPPVQGVPYSSPPPGSTTPSYPSPPGSSTPPVTAAPPPPTSGESPGHTMPPSQGSPPSTGYQPPFASSPSGEPTTSPDHHQHHPFPFTTATFPYAPPTHAPPESQAHAEGPVTALPLPTDLSRPMPQLLDSIQTASNRSFASLRSGISKLVDRVPSSKSSTTTVPTPSVGFTPSSGSTTMAASFPSMFCAAAGSSVSSLSSPSNASTTGYAVPQMLDEMPQSYGFNNLSHQSLFLADGSERSYYVLPEDYPLEQATKPMSPPAEKHVAVMVPPSVAAHAADVAPVLGFKANNTAGYESLLVPNLQLSMKVQDAPNVFKGMPVYDIYEEEDSGCLNITLDVRDFSLELQQQEDEKACNCPVLKASDSTVTSSNHLSIDHSMRALRLLWDPGASTFLVTPLKNDSSNVFSYHGKTDLWSQSEHQFIVFRAVFEKIMLDIPPAKPPERYGSVDSSPVNVRLRAPPLNVLVIHEKRNEWDRDRKFHSLFMTAADATKLQCTDVYKFGLVHILAVQFGAKRELISESAIMCSCALGFGWTEMNAAAVLVLLVPCPKGSYVAKHSMFLSNGGTSITKRYSPKLLMQLFCVATSVQVTEQRQPLKFSLIVAILPNESEFRDEQLAYMCQGTSINYSDWVMHKVQYCCLQIVLAGPYYVPVYYSSKFSSTSTIISTRCMSTASTVHMIPVLGSGKPIQEENGSIAVYQVSKTQIPMSKTSHIWDPGTMLLSDKSKWWLLYTEENTNGHKDIKCYGVALWLIHFQPP